MVKSSVLLMRLEYSALSICQCSLLDYLMRGCLLNMFVFILCFCVPSPSSPYIVMTRGRFLCVVLYTRNLFNRLWLTTYMRRHSRVVHTALCF